MRSWVLELPLLAKTQRKGNVLPESSSEQPLEQSDDEGGQTGDASAM